MIESELRVKTKKRKSKFCEEMNLKKKTERSHHQQLAQMDAPKLRKQVKQMSTILINRIFTLNYLNHSLIEFLKLLILMHKQHFLNQTCLFFSSLRFDNKKVELSFSH